MPPFFYNCLKRILTICFLQFFGAMKAGFIVYGFLLSGRGGGRFPSPLVVRPLKKNTLCASSPGFTKFIYPSMRIYLRKIKLTRCIILNKIDDTSCFIMEKRAVSVQKISHEGMLAVSKGIFPVNSDVGKLYSNS